MPDSLDSVLDRPQKNWELAIAWLSAGFAIFAGLRGLGAPNHPYQYALGFLAIALAYHRAWLPWRGALAYRLLAPLDVFIAALLFKLFIGSGKHTPLAWLYRPEVKLEASQGKWYEVLPQIAFQWKPMDLATWELDLTLVQSFLLIVTLVGAAVRFQPFTSFTAVLLLLASLPAFASFDWSWVFPAMMAASATFYLQSVVSSQRLRFTSER